MDVQNHLAGTPGPDPSAMATPDAQSRNFQFSLRTLFIVLTLCAVVLSLSICKLREHSMRGRARAAKDWKNHRAVLFVPSRDPYEYQLGEFHFMHYYDRDTGLRVQGEYYGRNARTNLSSVKPTNPG